MLRHLTYVGMGLKAIFVFFFLPKWLRNPMLWKALFFITAAASFFWSFAMVFGHVLYKFWPEDIEPSMIHLISSGTRTIFYALYVLVGLSWVVGAYKYQQHEMGR